MNPKILAVVAAIGAIGAIAVFVLLINPDGKSRTPFAPNGRTGDARLDRVIKRLLTENADQLATSFTTATAREGAVVGGPVGLGDQQTL